MQLDLPNEKQEYIDQDFAEHVEECKECFPECETRFKPGSYGFFELVDRSMQAYEYFEHYVLGSCATAVDKEVYTKAHQIAQALYDFYQLVALKDFDADEQEKHRYVGEFFDWATEKVKKNQLPGVLSVDALMEEWIKDNPPTFVGPEGKEVEIWQKEHNE